MFHRKKLISHIGAGMLALTLTSTSALAAGDYGGTTTTASSGMTKATKAIKAKDFDKAYKILSIEVKKSPKDADVHNLLGYSSRKLGQYDKSEAHYTRALELDPKHKGALEYMGELYLTLNNLEKAEELRARLDKVCWLGCDELDELDAAIASWKANNS